MPSLAELFALALRHHQDGDPRQAELLYRKVLKTDPTHADAYHALGVLACQTGRPEAAVELLRQAIALNPAAANYHFSLGTVLKAQGQPQQAVACFQQALQLNPQYEDALVNLGTVFMELDKPAEAAPAFRAALRLNPNHAGVHNNLGVALKILGQLEEAIACYRQALHIDPQYADALDNLAIALKDQGDLVQAAECCREALEYQPSHPNAANSMGVILQAQGNWDEATAWYERALVRKPDHASARWNLSLARLLLGDLARAWPDYEYRWQVANSPKRHEYRPRWDGSPLAGKTILLHAEQGLGDTIQFVRYAPLVKQRGGTVLLECQPELVHLLESVAGIDRLIARGAALPSFDLQIPLLSLPGLLGTTLATIPADIPYLHADRARVERWRHFLVNSEPTATADVVVGIAWQGSTKHPGDCWRSIPLTFFATLASQPKSRLVSLQVGPGTEQLRTTPLPIFDLGSRFDPSSLDDLAATLMNLDLVVTADTAVAHLAGALGVPVWLALPFSPDWRWLLERSDSPWYPTMRVFRQHKPTAWAEVFERIATELKKRSVE